MGEQEHNTGLKIFPSLLFIIYLLSFFRNSSAGDTITPTMSLIDNGQSLVSSSGDFELGFFSPGSSPNRYLGIWLKKIPSPRVVWVANRERPLSESNGMLNLTNEGILILLDQTREIVWSSMNSFTKMQNLVSAQLLDSGNLIVKDQNNTDPNIYIWQSFDHPCDTLLPGMKLGWNFKTGQNLLLSSWKTASDPSQGEYTFEVETQGIPQLVIKNGGNVVVRMASWNGIQFTGFPNKSLNSVLRYQFISNFEEAYFTLVSGNQSFVEELLVQSQSQFLHLTWDSQKSEWIIYEPTPMDQCLPYDVCGSYALCTMENLPLLCECLDGFVPKLPESNWKPVNQSSGCIRRAALDCGNGEKFKKYSGVKLPDTRNAIVDKKMNITKCEEECLRNCSCSAYAVADIKEGNGCLLWFGDLIDIRRFDDNQQELFLKLAALEFDKGKGGLKKKRVVFSFVIFVPLLLGMLLLGLTLHIWRRKQKKKGRESTGEDSKDLELPLFDFEVLSAATGNFTFVNKIGQGGFGPVYYGKLLDGQEIAVKRLSKNSSQGLNEFKNEVILISKLQHRNLVKLLGCCIQGEEKMLAYEYLPNKSLDSFIFDHTKRSMLEWQKRYNIIYGIARGLLYLHQDSRLRIIHRDLKSSNILLDKEMNPKISDFGLARSFGGDQSEANTNRVVGTYGYMSPEYAIDGLFSTKSDIFSFGVIVLEIVTGQKNRGFCHPEHYHNLLGHAWMLWREGDPSVLIDTTMGKSVTLAQALRCIHVGLLCVQRDADDRPSMSSVVSMLRSEIANLPQPKQPGFFVERSPEEGNQEQEDCSANEMTITSSQGR